jgi:hypothetical protein
MVSDPLSNPKNPIKSIGYLTREKKHNDINSLHSELSVVSQKNDNELSSVVCSSVVSTVVTSDLHYSCSVVVVEPSDLPSELCSVVVYSSEEV